jgi:hypothetical protein
VQSAINDGRLIFTEGTKMKIYTDPFPVNVINFENKHVLIRSDQADWTNLVGSRIKSVAPGTKPKPQCWLVLLLSPVPTAIVRVASVYA